jgi:hypothetical protein
MPENVLDPKPEPTPEVEMVNMTINIPKPDLIAMLENQGKWQQFWYRDLPQFSFQAAMNFKGYVANNFKAIENKEELKAATKRIQDLEQPLPQIQIMPSTAKIPQNVKDAIGAQGHGLQPVIQNREARRHKKP